MNDLHRDNMIQMLDWQYVYQASEEVLDLMYASILDGRTGAAPNSKWHYGKQSDAVYAADQLGHWLH